MEKRRTRRRIVVHLSQFNMFQIPGESGSNQNMDMVENLGDKSEECRDGGSEREKFCRSLDLACSCTDFLFNGWSNLPFFRCCGGKRWNQKSVCVFTLRLKRTLRTGCVVTYVMANIIIEEESRKLRNICIRREVDSGYIVNAVDEQNGIKARSGMGMEQYKYLCSCHTNWEDGGLNDSKCWHVESLKGNARLMVRINEMVKCGFQPEHGVYFGQFLMFREVVVDGCVNFELDTSDGQTGLYLDARNGLIAIQMDDCTKGDIVKRGSSVSKRWLSWVVVDAAERNLVSVMWRAVSSGIAETSMKCVMCRSDV